MDCISSATLILKPYGVASVYEVAETMVSWLYLIPIGRVTVTCKFKGIEMVATAGDTAGVIEERWNIEWSRMTKAPRPQGLQSSSVLQTPAAKTADPSWAGTGSPGIAQGGATFTPDPTLPEILTVLREIKAAMPIHQVVIPEWLSLALVASNIVAGIRECTVPKAVELAADIVAEARCSTNPAQ